MKQRIKSFLSFATPFFLIRILRDHRDVVYWIHPEEAKAHRQQQYDPKHTNIYTPTHTQYTIHMHLKCAKMVMNFNARTMEQTQFSPP